MSHTDHARKRRVPVPGHRAEVRQVNAFFGERPWQVRCSCGKVSHTFHDRVDAEAAKAAHLREVSDA